MSPPPSHYDAALERDLTELRGQLRRMGGLVLRALKDAARALTGRDRALAYGVILGDNRIDAFEGTIDRMCQEFLVRHMPAGGPLRFVIAAIKVNSELERMGDYADAVAHRVVTLHSEPHIPALDAIAEMFQRAIAVLNEALEAFLLGDAARAEAAIAMEGEVDALNRTIFDQLSHPEPGESDLTKRFAVLGILNRLERVADRAVNIAEDAAWAAKGEIWRHNPRHEQRLLFVSPKDATLGPMAEAIARARAPLHLSFASAGIHPSPLNPQMVRFMARRGYEVSRPRPRGIADIGSLDDYRIVVTISREAEEGCPPIPYHTVQLYWDVPDPSQATGTEAEIEAVFEAVFRELEVKITDLIAAVLGATPEDEEVT